MINMAIEYFENFPHCQFNYIKATYPEDIRNKIKYNRNFSFNTYVGKIPNSSFVYDVSDMEAEVRCHIYTTNKENMKM